MSLDTTGDDILGGPEHAPIDIAAPSPVQEARRQIERGDLLLQRHHLHRIVVQRVTQKVRQLGHHPVGRLDRIAIVEPLSGAGVTCDDRGGRAIPWAFEACKHLLPRCDAQSPHGAFAEEKVIDGPLLGGWIRTKNGSS